MARGAAVVRSTSRAYFVASFVRRKRGLDLPSEGARERVPLPAGA